MRKEKEDWMRKGQKSKRSKRRKWNRRKGGKDTRRIIGKKERTKRKGHKVEYGKGIKGERVMEAVWRRLLVFIDLFE